MTIELIIEKAGIPLLLFAICMYYGIRLITTQNISLIRGKDKKPVRDEKGYARRGGMLILFLGAATLLMAVLLFVNVYAAVGEIIVCTLIMGIAWKKMTDQYEN